MGRSKMRRNQARRKPKLDCQFDCFQCDFKKSVEVKMHKKKKVAYIGCRVCGANYQTPIHKYSAEIDVFGEWFEAYNEEEERKERAKKGDPGLESSDESDE
jgi:transcription elongation factor Elf1